MKKLLFQLVLFETLLNHNQYLGSQNTETQVIKLYIGFFVKINQYKGENVTFILENKRLC